MTICSTNSFKTDNLNNVSIPGSTKIIFSSVGTEAERDDYVGVWVDDDKIAAFGVRLSKSITMHGFGLTINTNFTKASKHRNNPLHAGKFHFYPHYPTYYEL